MISGGPGKGGKIGGGGGLSVDYYLDHVGTGREGYYLDAAQGGKEPPGHWHGKLAARLGLEGEVQSEDMHVLFESFMGPNGELLGQAPANPKSVAVKLEAWQAKHPDAMPHEIEEARTRFESTQRATVQGYDLTYAPGKSVSIAMSAAEVAAGRSRGGERAAAVVDRLDSVFLEACHAAMDVWENGVLRTQAVEPQRQPRVVETAWAVFPQNDNRNGDPQKHGHMVLLNKALDEEGKYRALDGRTITATRWGVAAFAENLHAAELDELGLPMTQRPDGSWEVDWISPALCDTFSSRRTEIKGRAEEYITAFKEMHGYPPPPLAVAQIMDRANQTTKAAKSHDKESTVEFLSRIATKAREQAGESMAQIGARVVREVERRDVERAKYGPRQAEKWSPEAVITEAIEAVAKGQATWSRGQLQKQIIDRMPIRLGQITPAQRWQMFEEITDQALERVVKVTGAALVPGIIVREADARYAARDTLAGEEAFRRSAIERGGHQVAAEALAAWLAEHRPDLSADQVAAVVGLGSSTARTSVLIGPAGTGKTRTAGGLAEAWEALSGGGRVYGIAVGQIAVEALKDDGVENAHNVAAFLAAQERLATGRGTEADRRDFMITSKDLVVVDELSMVDVPQMLAVQRYTDRAAARTIGGGDQEQLAAIGAGGVMSLLRGHAEEYRLAEPRRFVAEWEAEASLGLRDGNPEAVATYDRHGRFVAAATVEEAQRAAARGLVADMADGKRSMVITGTNVDAAAVNATVRDMLQERGQVDVGGVALSRDRGGAYASGGDLVMTRRNNHRHEVVNRQVYRVDAVTEAGGLRVVNADGEVRDLPASYVEKHVGLAYAGTAHAAQGVTLDRARPVLTGQEKRSGVLVPMTRGRELNQAYVVTPEGQTAAAVVAHSVETSGEELAATVAAEQDAARLANLHTIGEHYEAVVRMACRERMDRHLDGFVAEGALAEADRVKLGNDQSAEALSRALRRVEVEGGDPHAVLRAALTDARGLGSADSVGQVLMSRVKLEHRMDGTASGCEQRPADIDETHGAWLDMLADRAEDRRGELGAQMAEETPGWLVTHLGPVPASDAPERAAWEERAGKVAGYREVAEWSDEQRALPSAPSAYVTEQRSAWGAAWDALGRPEQDREEATLTNGALRARVTAFQREQAWAPAFADIAQREAEQNARKAADEAALADDEVAAKQAKADAAAWEAKAAAMQTAHEAYAAFVDNTRVTAEKADRARAALEERNEPYGQEPDRTTGPEWLGIEEESRVVDDAHREVTEVDVDEHQVEAGDHRAAIEAAERAEMDLLFGRYAQTGPMTEEELETSKAATTWALDQIADRESLDATEPEADPWGYEAPAADAGEAVEIG